MEVNGRISQQSNDGGAANRQPPNLDVRVSMMDQLNGDGSGNGNGTDDHSGLKNGNGAPSRPGSSTAFNRPNFDNSLQKNSPKLSPNHIANSPGQIPQIPLQIAIPPQVPNGNSFQLQTSDTTSGGSRPFAGATNLSTSNNISESGPGENGNGGGGPPAPFEYVGEDLFGLAALDFSFESFIDFNKDDDN